jgi:multiple sugar transport system ATP-binding protein
MPDAYEGLLLREQKGVCVMARVQFDHVYKRFGKVEVVHDINIDIKDHEFLVLVGPSGCGKSTCLRMIAGLEDISEGEVRIGDRVVNNVDPKDRDIAMVFQNYALYPHMTVFDNMAFGLKLRHFPKDQIAKRVEEAAEILGLTPYLKRKPKELSGGQRQRVALGRAIVRDAQVFLDEPLSNLDAKLRVQTRAEISKIHQRIQTTVIYVTHDQVEAMTMGDRIAVLNAGLIQQLGAPQELYDHPANIFVAGFIGSPAMNFFNGAKVATNDGTTKIVLDGIGEVTIPPLYVEPTKAAADKNLTFGIRPEHLEDASLVRSDASDGGTISAPVDVVEHLGSELLVYMTAGGKSIVARLDPRSDAHSGGTVTLHVDPNHIHLFDTDTGEAIY